MKKEVYEVPNMEVIAFETEDVIATSILGEEGEV